MNQIPFFISTHSSRGYVSFFDDCFGGLQKRVILSGWPGKAANVLWEKLLSRQTEEPVWVIRHSMDGSTEGLVFPKRSAGVYLARPWDTAVCSGMAFDPEYIPVRESLEEAHKHFAAALPIHDQWEAVYLQETNFGALDRLAEETAFRLLEGRSGQEQGKNQMRFLGAATVQGSVDVIPELTKKLSRRVFLKGRPGTGKSTFLKKLRAAANAAGWDTEEYRCAFDPNSADMVIIRGLGWCCFDSTAPHEHFPSREGDRVLDLYQAAVTPGTDEAFASQLKEIRAAYQEEIRQAKAALSQAQEAWLDMEKKIPWDDSAADTEMQEIEKTLFA